VQLLEFMFIRALSLEITIFEPLGLDIESNRLTQDRFALESDAPTAEGYRKDATCGLGLVGG
jgi:hypothetical protein